MSWNSSNVPPPDDLPTLQADEFLPPMRRWVRAGAGLLVGVLVGGAGVASVLRYNVTVQAIAIVRPLQEVTPIQAQTSGTLKTILVKENQPVQQGDVVAEFAGSEPEQVSTLQTRRRRLVAYLQQYDTQLRQVEHQLQLSDPVVVAGAGVSGLGSDRDRLQQHRQNLRRQIDYDQATLQEIDQALNRAAIVAPVNGTIFQLGLRYPGQAVQAGAVVAQIVPSPTTFVAKAQVNVQDISRVAVGQVAQLRISAYPYPDYGVLSGTVQAIAPDAVTVKDSTGITTSYYEVTIQPDQPYLTKGDQRYPLQPGMDARVDIISRQETVMQSLFRQLRLWSNL